MCLLMGVEDLTIERVSGIDLRPVPRQLRDVTLKLSGTKVSSCKKSVPMSMTGTGSAGPSLRLSRQVHVPGQGTCTGLWVEDDDFDLLVRSGGRLVPPVIKIQAELLGEREKGTSLISEMVKRSRSYAVDGFGNVTKGSAR